MDGIAAKRSAGERSQRPGVLVAHKVLIAKDALAKVSEVWSK